MVYYISVFVIFILSYLFGDLSSHWDCGMKTNTLYRLQYILLFFGYDLPPTADICATIQYDTENYICSSVELKYKKKNTVFF